MTVLDSGVLVAPVTYRPFATSKATSDQSKPTWHFVDLLKSVGDSIGFP
jgi:hypothetical protein